METEFDNRSRFPLQVSRPLLDVLSVIHGQVADTMTLDFETIGSERVVLALYDRELGFWDKHNLGKITLHADSLTETEVTVETPPYPSDEDSFEWAYDQKVADFLEHENFEAQEAAFLTEVSANRPFLVPRDDLLESVYKIDIDAALIEMNSYGLVAQFFDARLILQSVNRDDLIFPEHSLIVEEGDDFESLAERYYGDIRYAEDLRQAMLNYRITEEDLNTRDHLPSVVICTLPDAPYSNSEYKHANDFMLEVGYTFYSSGEWDDLARRYNLPVDRLLDLFDMLYLSAKQVNEANRDLLPEWGAELHHVRKKRQTDLLSSF